MHIVRSFGVLSVAKIMGLIYGCLGLILAPFFLLIGLLGSVVDAQKTLLPECSEWYSQFSCPCSTG